MPAEWEPHRLCWMAWPRDHGDWPVAYAEVVENFLSIADAIANFEPVQMLVDPADLKTAQRRAPAAVDLLSMELDDCWMRDMGPTMVRDHQGGLSGINWRYNGWGKFPHQHDQWVAKRLLEQSGYPLVDSFLVNEGGAIHTDGAGTLVLTESVLFNDNRNPGLDRVTAEQELRACLGVEQMVWLPGGLVDDDTDGHIDELMCFSSPGNMLVLSSSDAKDANYPILQQAQERLAGARDRGGRQWRITPIEQPPAAYLNGARLSRSYVNCYIANGAVVMPAYGVSDFDQEAQQIVGRACPDREIVQLDCSALVTGGGNIHCITQQCPEGEPAGELRHE